jgi:tRNA (uracil-5-)-methyltransferase
MSAHIVVNTARVISSLACHRSPETCISSLRHSARSGVPRCQVKKLSAAMSTRVRSPTSDPEVNAPLEKKMRLRDDMMGGADGIVEEASNSAIGVPGPTKKASIKLKKKQKHVLPEPYSPGDVLWRDVVALLGNDIVEHALQHGTEWDSPFGHRDEVEVEVSKLSSNGAHEDVIPLLSGTDNSLWPSGDALAHSPTPHPPWVIVAPFALPGERIRVRVYRSARLHSFADLVEVITPNPDLRDDSRVKCRYFGRCSGCQYQVSWMSFGQQTEHQFLRVIIPV